MTLRRADRLTYADLVGDFFLELRGRGLMLSPADLARVRQWETAGIPAEVVCRGLQLAFDTHRQTRPGVRPPQNLAYYAPAVAEAWRAAREKALGADPT